MKNALVIAVVIIVIIAAIIVTIGTTAKQVLNGIENDYAALKPVDLSSVPDGTYSAKRGSVPVFVDLEVIVRGGRIADVTILKQRSGPDHQGADTAGRIVAQQKILVDAVSGSTISSKLIMLTVNEALSGGRD